MQGCRQLPASGQAFFCRQLHVLLTSVAAVVTASLACEDVRMRLLWLSMIRLVLFIQL